MIQQYLYLQQIVFKYIRTRNNLLSTFNNRVPAEPGGLTNPPFLFYGPVQVEQYDKECGSNDDHLPALTVAVTIYFKGIGHDIIYFPLFTSVSLPIQKNK